MSDHGHVIPNPNGLLARCGGSAGAKKRRAVRTGGEVMGLDIECPIKRTLAFKTKEDADEWLDGYLRDWGKDAPFWIQFDALPEGEVVTEFRILPYTNPSNPKTRKKPHGPKEG